MRVNTKIEQATPTDEEEQQALHKVAVAFSNDASSVDVLPLAGEEVGVEVRFCMADARQGDVVDRIAARFRRAVRDYQDMTISFDSGEIPDLE